MNSVFRMLTLAAALALEPAADAAPRADPLTGVEELLAQRSGAPVRLPRTGSPAAQAVPGIAPQLSGPLTAEVAVEIALLHNPGLQATVHDLAIAQADKRQAGALKNPVIHGEIRFPNDTIEFGATQDVTDILWRSMRMRTATSRLEQSRLQLAHAVMEFSAEVRAAFFSLQTAERSHALRAEMADAAEASAELSRRQEQAGNISPLMFENSQVIAEETTLELAESDLERVAARERLGLLLGVTDAIADLRVAPDLPELPAVDPAPEGLQSRALSQRLDFAAAGAEVAATASAITWTRYSHGPAIGLGVHIEREPDGTNTVGPSIEISLPIFDGGGSAIASARAALQQSQQRRAALAAAIGSAVRVAHARLSAARQRVTWYREVVIPRRERIVAHSQKEYNFMLLGTYELIRVKREETNARRAGILAQRDYWLAHLELERAVGGRLSAATDVTMADAGDRGPAE